MLPDRAIQIIKHYEGWHRALPDGRAAPYLCPANKWTIGWGATFGLDGKVVTAQSEPITREQGERLLAGQLVMFHRGVVNLIKPGVELNANQIGALTSFAFNLGLGRLRSSTLLKRINGGNLDAAAVEFPKWVYGGGRVLPGLVKRRRSEIELFLAPVQLNPPLGTAGSPYGDENAVVGAGANAGETTWVSRFLASLRRAQEGHIPS